MRYGRFSTSTIYFAQQGSSQDLRVTNEERWYVVKQVFEGARIMNTSIVASYPDRESALDKVDELFGYLTPAEVAEITNTAQSTWRNKCAGGEVRGAIKKGKQWLIPRSAIADLEIE